MASIFEKIQNFEMKNAYELETLPNGGMDAWSKTLY